MGPGRGVECVIYLRLGRELTFFISGTSHLITCEGKAVPGEARVRVGTMSPGYLS